MWNSLTLFTKVSSARMKKKDTSSKKPDNFPRKHTEIEHNSQKFIPQNTVFLGFILNRI